ncbi:MAG: UbiD family decarboxylase [Thermodesulfobacteriota bacterium]
MMLDLRSFLDRAKEDGDLLELRGVDWDVELGTLSELLVEKGGPTLLFDKFKGYPEGYRVATNLYTTVRRFSIAIGMPPDTDKMEIIKRWRATDFKPIKPVDVKTGPVMGNVHVGDDVNLYQFPVPRYHERDGGRYIGTGVVVIMRDPDAGYVNVGVQRVMIHDEKTVGLYISPGKHNAIIRKKYWSKGKSCPVVMDFGPPPILWLSAASHVSWGVSEFDWAGYLANEPQEVISGEITGLPIPAHSEIAIEGEYLPPEVETRTEGPFGEWTGYYGGAERDEPVVRVKAVYHRNKPILAGAPPIKPPNYAFAVPVRTTPLLWNALEKAGVGGIKGVWNHEAGGGRMIVIISLEQSHGGHAMQAGLAVIGSHAGGYMSKLVIVVDEDIDPTDLNEVLWAVVTRANFEESVSIIKGCWGTRLDPALPPEKRERGDLTHSAMIINACRPFYWKDHFPPVNEASDELRAKVSKKWRDKIDLLRG